MKQKIISVLLVFVLVLGLLPMTAQAASQDAADALCRDTKQSYRYATSRSGQSSFHGLCGTMVAYQLRYLGITKSVNKCDGNKMYDRYKNQQVTTGGFYTTPYSGKKYSLEEALNAISRNGTKDVYNILVGFEWTNTEAGGKFGHAVLINGILDGTVYFVESFDSAIGGAEGNVIALSIPAFVKYYNRWTRFDGCIHFVETLAESLESWETDLVLRTAEKTQLYSQPALTGEHDSQMLRSVSAGERLLATQVLKDRQDRWFYRVSDGAYTGYVPAQAVTVEQFSTEELAVTHLSYADTVAAGQALEILGTVSSRNSKIDRVEAVITDATGEEVARISRQSQEQIADLSQLELPVLPAGRYALMLTVHTEGVYVTQAGLERIPEGQVLLDMPFWVGPVPRTGSRERSLTRTDRNGWYLYGGSWYYFENNEPRTGWFRENGVSYYLDETGAATTGWAEVDGQTCLFSATGALCTGWIRVEAGLHYCAEGGRFANGWQIIEGNRYYFADGILQTAGTYADGDVTYVIGENGLAVPATAEEATIEKE